MHFFTALLITVFVLSFLIPLLGFSFVFAPVASLFVVTVGKLVDIEAVLSGFFLEESKFDEGPFILIRWLGTLISGVLALIFLLLKLVYFFLVVFPAAIGGALHDGFVVSIKRYIQSTRPVRKFLDVYNRWHAPIVAQTNNNDDVSVGLEQPDTTLPGAGLTSIEIGD